METFLATVDHVYPTNTDFIKYEKSGSKISDNIPIYNGNTDFSDEDSRFYGAITYKYEDTIKVEDYAFPFDKNNFTFPIKGETVIILKIEGQTFYLPYTNTPYSNYRRDYITFEASKAEDTQLPGSDKSGKQYSDTVKTGGNTVPTTTTTNKLNYLVKDKVKFLNPKEGDTIITGRVGNTIRFSEFHLTEDGKTSSPSIFIRNKQNPELDSKKIGELVDEDINKDGSSFYITSNKVKVPFVETVKKTRVGFRDFPNSKDLSGDQIFLNSDRVVLSSKAYEFIIFGRGNTGIITDGNFSVDAERDVYLHSNNKVTIHSAGTNQIFLNSDNGKIFLGKNAGEGGAGAEVQKMVLGGELVKIMGELIDEITKQIYATPVGPTATGPVNAAAFKAIKGKLNVLLSSKNYLSK